MRLAFVGHPNWHSTRYYIRQTDTASFACPSSRFLFASTLGHILEKRRELRFLFRLDFGFKEVTKILRMCKASSRNVALWRCDPKGKCFQLSQVPISAREIKAEAIPTSRVAISKVVFQSVS